MSESRETAHFLIHYETSGPNGVPDLAYVDTVAVACERAWTAYHVERGWDRPPGDGGFGGGSDKTDCTIQDGDGLGHAEIIAAVPGGAPYDYTAQFFIDHDISPNCLLQSAVVHEYMHVVQAGYGVVTNVGWYLENSAVLAQEWAYDSCDNYVDWLYCFFEQPHRSLITHDGCYEYGSSVWPMYQEERFQDDVVKQIWDDFQWSGNIHASHAAVLANYGQTTGSAYLEFIRWCFFTGNRADPSHFQEASLWADRLMAQRSHSSYPTGNQHPIVQPEALGTAILLFTPESGSSDTVLDLAVDGPDCTLGVQLLVKEQGEQSYSEYGMGLDGQGNGVFSLSGFDTTDSVFVLVSMSTTCGVPRDFVYSADTRVDPADVSAPPELAMTCQSWRARPNPVSGEVTLSYRLSVEAHVEIDILSPDGRVRRNLFDAHQTAGAHAVLWNRCDAAGRTLPSGVYLARVRAGGRERSQKLVLAR